MSTSIGAGGPVAPGGGAGGGDAGGAGCNGDGIDDAAGVGNGAVAAPATGASHPAEADEAIGAAR